MKRVMKLAASLSIAAAISCFAGSPVAYAEDLFTVTLLGTGSPRPTSDRNGPSTLVEVGGQRLLFDMGRNNTVSLFRAHVPVGSINAHFLTHLHSDHINGLPDLYLTGWIGAPFGQRKSSFLIYGPKGTQDMMQHLYAAFSEDRRVRHADEHETLESAQIDAHDIEPGVIYQKDGVTVSAFPVFHGELIKPAYGYKIEYKGHKVVLSGDTKYTKTVEKEGTGADLLIHEVATLGGDTDKVIAAHPIYRSIVDHHITPEQAGTLFTNAHPKMAVYSHIVLPSESLPDPSGQIITQTRTTYSGPLVVGEDMMRFRVGEQGISIEKI